MSISSCKAQYTGQSPKPAGVAPGGSKGGPAMSGMQVNSASAASRQAQSAAPAAEKRDTGPDLYEMMRDAREKAEAAREKLNAIKP